MTAELPSRATRGHGLVEGILARKRCAMALHLLREVSPLHAVLDIGCGSFPTLLDAVSADRRVGIDQLISEDAQRTFAARGIDLVRHDIAAQPRLPFDDEAFDAVTMLAFIEHISLEVATALMPEVHRVLRPGGVLVLTTPPPWTDRLLRVMARGRLVSAEEIEEHTSYYSLQALRAVLAGGGFPQAQVETGTFEWGLNLWARAARQK